MIYYVDTNYFLRFFLDDNKKQTRVVRDLFLKGSRAEVELFSSLVVFLEIYWVLQSYYGFSKNQVAESLEAILKMDFIKLDNEEVISLAMEIFKNHNLDLEDCFHLAYSRGKSNQVYKIATFDKKLQNVHKLVFQTSS